MDLQSGILANAKLALAALAALFSLAGLAMCVAGYAAFFFFLQSTQSAVVPQLDSAIAAVSGAEQTIAPAAASAENASGAIIALSDALLSYSQVSKNLSDSIGSIAAIPPFSLDARFSSAAGGLKQASNSFGNASLSLNASASSAVAAASAMRNMSSSIGNAKTGLETAKNDVKSAFSMLNIAALASTAALVLLFSSVLMLAIGNLLPAKKDGAK